MEKEQLEKKVQWLDAERRKALDTILDLETRLASLEKANGKEAPSGKALGGQTTRMNNLTAKMTELEKLVKAQAADTKKDFQEFEKQRKLQEKSFQQDQKGLNRLVEDFRKEVGILQALQTGINVQETRLGQLNGSVESLKESIQEVITGEQRRAQLARSLEAASKEDAQRLTEMHAEVAALLSRLESAAKQTEGILLSQRKVDKRMEELAAAEEERQTEHAAFLQQTALTQTDRERTWKEWSKRFDVVEQQSSDISTQLKDIETTDLALKRAQRAFDDLVEKINRRVNELGEMQRLGDQRFRQEWSTFQADAQKRWSNFSLSHEEQQRESIRQREKLAQQITRLEDSLREVQDTVQHLNDQTERNLQTMLEMARDSLAENERFISNSG